MASGAMTITGALGLGPASNAGAAVAPGIGTSYAQSFQITPHEGSLAVGVVLGEALAGHTNNVARAQSQGEDLGSVGLSMQGYTCGQPPNPTVVALVPNPLQAETPASGGVEDKTQDPSTGAQKTSPSYFPPSFGSTEHVLTNGTPYGEADTSYGLLDASGAFKISGMTSKAWSGLVDGNRVAAATSDIGTLDIAMGAVVIKGLHWEVAYPSGGSGQPTGSFSISQLTIGGKPVPTGDPSAALTALGIQLAPPTSTRVMDLQTVSPLEFRWVPNAARDAIVQQVSNPAAQALHPIEAGLESGFGPPEPAQLVQALCYSTIPITVADITIASFTGAGYFNMALGGVNATSANAPVNPYDLAQFQPTSVAGLNQSIAGTAATPGTPGALGTGGTQLAASAPTVGGGGAAPSTGITGGSRPIRRAAAVGHASGPLLAIGLGGLGLLALLVEGDRRMMRRARGRLMFEFEE
jgi:hypothetical protein